MIKTKRMMVLDKKRTPNHFYIPPGSFSNFKTAREAILQGSSTTYNINFLGDSITEGVGATNYDSYTNANKSYVSQVREKINLKYGNTGFGFIPVGYPYNKTLKWTFGGEGWTDSTYGANAYSKKSSTNGDTATLTFTGTGIGLLFMNANTMGKFTYSIDGSDPVEIDTYSAVTSYSKIYEITGLESGEHTITITNTTPDAKYLEFQGGYPITTNPGFRVNMVGRASVGMGSIGAFARSLCASIDVFTPVLTVISYSSNDFKSQLALGTYETYLKAIITRAKMYGDVLITTIGLRNESKTIPQESYFNVLRSVAVSENVPLLDIAKKWGNAASAVSNGYITSPETTHPNDVGHGDIASAVLDILDVKW